MVALTSQEITFDYCSKLNTYELAIKIVDKLKGNLCLSDDCPYDTAVENVRIALNSGKLYISK